MAALGFEGFVAAFVGDMGVAHFFQGLFGDGGAVAAAAVEVDGGVFVGLHAGDLAGDLVQGDVDGLGQAALGVFLRGAHVDPQAVGAGLRGGAGFGRGGGGVNIEATVKLAQAVAIPVIASGGLTNLDDIRALCAVEKYGVTGVITGRAIYEGSIDFAQAQQLADSLA